MTNDVHMRGTVSCTSYRNSLGACDNSMPFFFHLKEQSECTWARVKVGLVKTLAFNLLCFRKGKGRRFRNHWNTLALKQVGKLPCPGQHKCQNTDMSHHLWAGLHDSSNNSGKYSEHQVSNVRFHVGPLWSPVQSFTCSPHLDRLSKVQLKGTGPHRPLVSSTLDQTECKSIQ